LSLQKSSPLLPLALLISLGLLPCLACAQAQGIVLRSSPRLQEALSSAETRQGHTVVEADRMEMRPDMDATLDGAVVLRRPSMVVHADHLRYDQTRDHLDAQGHVRIYQKGNVFEGPVVELQLDSFTGHVETPTYRLVQGGHGDAKQIEFIDEHRVAAHQARYTTCRATPGPEWLPEWLLRASRIGTDTVEGTGSAEDVQIDFLGLKTPVLPSMQFPLESKRASGLLIPLVSIDSVSGIDYMQPYYWDIAPHRDATLVTHVMSRRGVAFESEFRYLESEYNGHARLNLMPNDPLRHTRRWGLMTQHNGRIETGTDSLGSIQTALSINRVSDDNYWRDFPRTYLGNAVSGATLTQRVLPSTGVATWSRGAFTMVGQVQRWQTQQDVADINKAITPPYDRAPQLTMRYGQWNDNGIDWSVIGDSTRFEADHSRLPVGQATLRNGTRSYTQTQVSRPWLMPWGYITPKVQLHATRYALDTPLDNGNTVFNRVLPTFSLDSGLVFEREMSWLGKSMSQTLEPRVVYVRTPYVDQSILPLYDTGMTDFNMSTIFGDNPYVGQDRIVDNNTVTFGANSRFFDAQSGMELMRLGIAQRLRLSDQRVTINPNSADDQKGLSDLLLGAGTRWNEQLSLDGTVQLNNQTQQIRRTTLQTRYNPGPYRLFNVAYRQNKTTTTPSESVDFGWQWPMSDLRMGQRPDDSGVKAAGQGLGGERWYSVGRLNYSMTDKRPVNMLLGFEYDAGCWLGRIAFERLQNTTTSATTRLMFQLELVGLGRVGVSPLDALRNNIQRYQLLRESPSAPSRFLQYE
jgi:LPS-assembly protein